MTSDPMYPMRMTIMYWSRFIRPRKPKSPRTYFTFTLRVLFARQGLHQLLQPFDAIRVKQLPLLANSVSAGTPGYFRSWGKTGCAISE